MYICSSQDINKLLTSTTIQRARLFSDGEITYLVLKPGASIQISVWACSLMLLEGHLAFKLLLADESPDWHPGRTSLLQKSQSGDASHFLSSNIPFPLCRLLFLLFITAHYIWHFLKAGSTYPGLPLIFLLLSPRYKNYRYATPHPVYIFSLFKI